MAENKPEARKPLTKEEKATKRAERMEYNVNLAKQPDARVIRINSPGGATMATILRQFDSAYDELKNRLGEPGDRGVSFDDGEPLAKEMLEILVRFSKLTEKISNKVRYTYNVPNELKGLVEVQAE